ncbi:MAG: ABC transporter ATP-binding protein, partial [Proteobacteria bacterium]|nr:ABC transporter ATP-binding protein [Pseudomonadota bacterium]
MSSPMIHATELTKRFGRIVAVDGVNLEVGAHGIVGLLGPNGAGKTTLMRILTGFIPMSEGNAVVAGFDVFEEPAKVKARVGYLPETPPLYPELTIGEYLRFVAEIREVPRAGRLSQVGEAMEKVGLQRRENELLSTLSKGYRQRVGLAQAIVHRPSLLILDEPTSGLDPAQLVPIRQLIRDIGQDRLVLFSTHVLHEVQTLCDRVIVINRGKIVGDGTTKQLASDIGG